jgi:hypothetical protein
MATQKIILTEHFKNERLDRYVYIVTTVGIGEPVTTKKIFDDEGRWAYHTITTTGVIIIRNPCDELVTMFIANKAQAKRLFDNDKMPMVLEGVVNRNASKRYADLQNEVAG